MASAQWPSSYKDYLTVCRYNQGPSKRLKLQSCMEYNAKVLKNYNAILKGYKNNLPSEAYTQLFLKR